MAAPAGAPGSRLKVSVLAGTSASVAVAVKVSVLPSLTDLLPMAARIGATLTSLTVMLIVWESLRAGEPLSVTRTVTEKVAGPWVSVGVQVKTPVAGSMLAPLGALIKLKVRALAGESGSLAVAVKL